MTHSEFAAKAGIRFTVTPADDNPNVSDMGPGARHWLCTLWINNTACREGIVGPREIKPSMQVPFSQGSAHTKPPTVADVLYCLAADAVSYEDCAGFESWAGELGYDTDSRKAEHTFKAVRRQARAMRALLGDDLYNKLLYETEEG